MATLDLGIGGMHCASCSMLIEIVIGDLPGVSAVKVDYARGTAHVVSEADIVSVADVVSAVEHAGYTASVAA